MLFLFLRLVDVREDTYWKPQLAETRTDSLHQAKNRLLRLHNSKQGILHIAEHSYEEAIYTTAWLHNTSEHSDNWKSTL